MAKKQLKNLPIIILNILCIVLIALVLFTGYQGNIKEPENNNNVYNNLGTNYGTYSEIDFSVDKEIDSEVFTTEKELNDFIQMYSSGSNGYYGLDDMMVKTAAGGMRQDMAVSVEMAESAPSAQPVFDSEGGNDYSETNVQVAGVDEADIIKTDGEYIYTVSGTTLFIVKAYPGEDAEVVSTLSFDSNPSSIFINDDHLAVFGYFNNFDYFRKMDFMPRNSMTFFNIYDISDKEDPLLVKEYKFEGGYFNARMTGSHVYLITTSRPEFRPIPMPMIMEGNVVRHIPVDDVFYFNIPYQSPSFVNMHAINLKDPDASISSKSVAVEGGQNLYMSEDNIYITYTEYVNEYEIQKQIMMALLEPYVSDRDRELIVKIKSTDNDILSRLEKESKIYQVYESYAGIMDPDEQDELQDKAESMLKKKLEEYKYFEFTVINKINVDADEITPAANGKVPGHIMNQFSLDEDKGILRIATTVSPRWSRFGEQRTESTNNVYTLDSGLKIMDELTDLAEGEQIYSTRFIGDRLYMVTFRQVDPFFVIDLSNPNNIKELGQLKIPGFSRYLHPYDKDTIIGIGQDATDTGRTTGLKISLFDVSDVENPKEVAKYVTESRYAGSTALYEHKAFLFSKEKELLVIPAYSYDYRNSAENYNGAFVFSITKDEIELRGLIDHSISLPEYQYSPAVERSLYIEELLYTKSPSLLRINRIDDLSKIKNVELKYTEPGMKVY
ncbi:MAG: beta-propeller domain-containing protein [Nanoarchaeota archaeon]|nr:beta-propeller domain-containing protein [Nanoarchaeota archaeon]